MVRKVKVLVRGGKHRYKLTKQGIQRILELVERGIGYRQIARDFGVSHTAIIKVVRKTQRRKERLLFLEKISIRINKAKKNKQSYRVLAEALAILKKEWKL